MNKTMSKPEFFADSMTMFKRSMTKQVRSPEALTMAIGVPVVMMILFGFVFGGIADVGYSINYMNFVVPGIIIMCSVISSQSTAYAIHTDMTTGIIDRFRSMAIAKSAVLSGHVWVSVLRSIAVVATTFGVAFLMGFRTSASFTEWLIIGGILVLFIIALTWVTVIIGLVVKDVEALSGAGFLLQVLIFVSSAFAPPETLPLALRIFATHQPFSRVINAVRGLVLGIPDNGEILLSVIWSVGITTAAAFIAITIYKSKLTK